MDKWNIVGKTEFINHPQNHHFQWWNLKNHQMLRLWWSMALGFPHYLFYSENSANLDSLKFKFKMAPENGEHSPTHWDSDLTTSSCRLLLKNVATRNCTPRDSEFQDLNPNANGLMTHWCFIIFCRFQTILGKTVIVFERDLSMRMIPITSRCYMNAIDFLMSQKGMSYLFYGCPLFF